MDDAGTSTEISDIAKGTQQRPEKLQQDESEHLPPDDADDHNGGVEEAPALNDLLTQVGTPVDNDSEDEVYWEARKHRSACCRLRIVGKNICIHSPKATEKILKFSDKSYVWVKPFPKGITLVFENCGLRSKVKPEHLPPGDPTREIVPTAQFHILHPQNLQLKIQHRAYVDGPTRDESKEFPVWDEDIAEHNMKYRSRFILKLCEIVRAAGGDCGGRR